MWQHWNGYGNSREATNKRTLQVICCHGRARERNDGHKNELEKNIADIEETSDNLSEEAEALYTKLQKHIEKIKNEYLRKLSEKSKECKEKLQENADSLGDKFAYLKRCKKSFNSMKEERRSSVRSRILWNQQKIFNLERFVFKKQGLSKIDESDI